MRPFESKSKWFVAGVVSLAVSACSTRETAYPEAQVRRVVPVPVCTEGITPPKRQVGADSNKAIVRTLDPEKWLEILVPGYDPGKGMNPTDVDCTGHYVFANQTLRYGVSKRGWPTLIDVDDVDMRAGAGGVTAFWLRAVTFENGDVGGPVALIRGVDDRAEVYAVGSYRGPADAKVTPVRMGNETIVVAEARRCPDETNCRTVASFFLLRRGRMVDAATVDLERVARVPSVSERGLFAEYRLKTDVSYQAGGIELLEQVKVKIIPYEEQGDRDSDRTLRTVEFKRLLQVERDTLFSSNESLWERVVGQD